MHSPPRAQTIIDDIDDLAYVGQGRLVFHDLSTEPEAAVYLNCRFCGCHLNRPRFSPGQPSPVDQFFSERFPQSRWSGWWIARPYLVTGRLLGICGA